MQHLNNKRAEKLLKITGNVLKSLREEKKLSLNLFAFENDIQKSLISRLENGKNDPKYLSLWKISEALDIKLSDLIKIIEDELPENWSISDE